MASHYDCSLLVLSDEPHFFDGHRYWCALTFDYFVSAIGSYLRRTTIAVPVVRDGQPFGHVIDLPHIELRALPHWYSLASFLLLSRSDRRRLREQARDLVAEHDAVFVRLPSLAAEVFAREAREQGKVFCTQLVANILSAAGPLHSPNPLVRLGAGLFARWVHGRQMRMVGQARVPLAVGHELHRLCLRHNPASEFFIETLVSEKDAYERPGPQTHDGPLHILCVSRLTRGKGLKYLLTALGLLVRGGLNVRLRVAGGSQQPDYAEELGQLARAEGVGDRVEWLGHVPFGEPLFRLYRESDVGVLPSLSEGFPRFINEAWASSLPLVCTRLPSLSPPVVDGENAILVDPGSGVALADGLRRLIEDGDLRRRLATAGLQAFRELTLERQSRRVAELIAAAAAGEPSFSVAAPQRPACTKAVHNQVSRDLVSSADTER
ncbi:MAG: glycosyltransferase family 4 protein [Planctomycetota bacterium]